MLSFAGMTNPVSIDLRVPTWSGPIRIMPLGDSITAGWGTPDSYRDSLWGKLAQFDGAFDFVGSRQGGPAFLPDRDHQGTPGQRADELIPLVSDLMRSYRPDIVLLMMGTNDVVQGGQAGASSLRFDIGEILSRIAAELPNTKVLVSTLPPLAADVYGSNFVPAANHEIRMAVADALMKGQPVGLVQPTLTVSDLYDGVHPTAAGHAKLADSWHQAIAAELSAFGENNVIGSEVGDRLIGNDTHNALYGRAGNDVVYGLGGEDRLYGAAGDDRLHGGAGNDLVRGDAGRDVMSGGAGYDRFVFTSVSNSRLTTRDVITDFTRGDKIDLSLIDANTKRSGNQAFKTVSDFTGSPGQLQWDKTSWGFTVSGDVNGDGRADFAMSVKTALAALRSSDFVL